MLPDAVAQEEAPAPAEPEKAPEEEAPRKQRRRIDARRLARLALVLLLVAAVLAGAGMAAHAARHHLAVWMPSTRGLFVAFGAQVKPSELSAAITGWRLAEGGAIIVAYRVANPAALPLALPEICVEGRAEEGSTAFRRCFAPEMEKLAPDQSLDSEFLVLDAAGSIREIELRKSGPAR